MKTWLKGGLIGDLILIVLSVISFIFGIFIIKEGVPLIYYFLFIIYPCAFFARGEYGSMSCILIGPIINLILVFVLGAIIAVMLKKRRDKKDENN